MAVDQNKANKNQSAAKQSFSDPALLHPDFKELLKLKAQLEVKETSEATTSLHYALIDYKNKVSGKSDKDALQAIEDKIQGAVTQLQATKIQNNTTQGLITQTNAIIETFLRSDEPSTKQRLFNKINKKLNELDKEQDSYNKKNLANAIAQRYEQLDMPNNFNDLHDATHIKDIAKQLGFTYKSNKDLSNVLRAVIQAGVITGDLKRISHANEYAKNTGPKLAPHGYGLTVKKDKDGAYTFSHPDWEKLEHPPVVHIGVKSKEIISATEANPNTRFDARIQYKGSGQYAAYVDRAYNSKTNTDINLQEYQTDATEAYDKATRKVGRKADKIKRKAEAIQLRTPGNPYPMGDTLNHLKALPETFHINELETKLGIAKVDKKKHPRTELINFS